MNGLRGQEKPRNRRGPWAVCPQTQSVTFPLAPPGLGQEPITAEPRRRSALLSTHILLEGSTAAGELSAAHGHLRPRWHRPSHQLWPPQSPRPRECTGSMAEAPWGEKWGFKPSKTAPDLTLCFYDTHKIMTIVTTNQEGGRKDLEVMSTSMAWVTEPVSTQVCTPLNCIY